MLGCNNSSKDSDSKQEGIQENTEVVIDSNENNRSYMRGEFVYYADGASFKYCSNGMIFDVQAKYGMYDEGEKYLDLETYYLKKDLEPLKPIYIEIDGHIVSRDEGEEGIKNVLVPTRFVELDKVETDCK